MIDISARFSLSNYQLKKQPMPVLEPYTGPTKLVVAFDIGTTFSGVSYCILEAGQVPEIHGITR